MRTHQHTFISQKSACLILFRLFLFLHLHFVLSIATISFPFIRLVQHLGYKKTKGGQHAWPLASCMLPPPFRPSHMQISFINI